MNPASSIQHPASLEADLLKQMLIGDLDIARRMAEIGDLTMCADALSGAASKLKQLKALAPQALECGSPMPLSQSAIDV